MSDAPPGTSRRAAAAAAVRERWDHVPLSERLVSIIVVLLGTGLALAGLASSTLLERELVAQVDAKLKNEGFQQVRELFDPAAPWDADATTPSDYYVVAQLGWRAQELVSNPYTVEEYGTPRVPNGLTPESAELGRPYTVASDRTGSRWRVVSYPYADGSDVILSVALPLRDIDRTATRMTWILVSSGAALMVIGAIVGGWAVQRSLRPLREIEDTAAAIAAGDLSQRVPQAPATTEVGRLGAALNGMLAQIEQAFDARTASEARMRRFVADASHELRTPLAAIRGYAELYRMGAMTTPEQVDDTMRRIEGSARRMGSLVEDLLALARLDEGLPGRLGPVDLTVLAADAVSDLRAIDPDRPVRLETLAPAAPVVVQGDEVRLRQVLANLVGNAAQHTPAGTPVEVRVGPAGRDADGRRTALLEVRDHGPGIPPEHAARVFERFYRVDASRTRESGGSGLGMAIAAAIVASHDGQVGIEETPGGGTTVRVVLPVDGPAGAAAADAPGGVTGRPSSGTEGAPSSPDAATMARPTSPS
ncbi:sensor histidine kinase [Cellulomonas shaoxiangyii]|uniref:histidine kinase n=1 Tax=Cellulomonas shaoxiangyii TaxID=2566013 RepID=A0A4P7SPD0_9CELL|nr:HAMP domain-containing sensor histidine kinase [Cellulomonas shaoxiangyii]QCB94563.1 HAMP domain-containing histidine kinase [Cellulomonas shaoxiangyii]TGY85031.1 HAMP domain-containing histidine kinase [Cellulomonas shaoxiangyii]